MAKEFEAFIKSIEEVASEYKIEFEVLNNYIFFYRNHYVN